MAVTRYSAREYGAVAEQAVDRRHGESAGNVARDEAHARGADRIEAALRVGAGKRQLATVASAALQLGLLVPEAAAIALREDADGEIGDGAGDVLEKPLEACDALVIGPGIGTPDVASYLLATVVEESHDDLALVIDAMAIGCAKDLQARLTPYRERLVLTPHHGEMAVLSGRTEDEIDADPMSIALDAARTFDAIVVLKGSDTAIAAPDGTLHYAGGGTGLATGGSGDVLAGAIAGLLSRGAAPLQAAGCGVWLPGQSGRRVTTTSGPIGFLAREVPQRLPRLLPQ